MVGDRMKVLKAITPLAGIFVVARLALFMALPLEGLRGYGDLVHFFNLAALPGLPYVDHWVEFPPVFPFLSSLIYGLANGQQHVYDYLLVFLFTLVGAGSLTVFGWLVDTTHPRQQAGLRSWAYLVVLLVVGYSWWYFDTLVVFALLLGMSLLLRRKSIAAGVAFGIGALIKFFPLIGWVAAWRCLGWRRTLGTAMVSVLLVGGTYGVLWALSPQFTAASLVSQASKGSWETVWALIDGNYHTGSFGALVERLNPALARLPRGNPAQISPWLTLPLFLGLGGYGLYRIKGSGRIVSASLVGFAFCLLFLWSPGWSPQWVLYLVPLILLTLPLRLGGLLMISLILINLLEWPLLLSRGFFWSLTYTVPLRTLLIALLAGLFYRQAWFASQNNAGHTA